MESSEVCGCPAPRDIYLADRADQSQMQSASVMYLAGIMAYGVGVLGLLTDERSEAIGPVLTGAFSVVTLVLMGFFGQHVSMQALRSASLVLQESRVRLSNPDIGQSVVERWNSFDSHGGDRTHRRALTASYALGTLVLSAGVVLPLYRLHVAGKPWVLAGFAVPVVAVVFIYVRAWRAVHAEVKRLHRLSRSSTQKPSKRGTGWLPIIAVAFVAVLYSVFSSDKRPDPSSGAAP